MSESAFRGYRAIGKIAEKLNPLADAGKFSPQLHVLRLFRADFDLVKRWPRASKMHGFEFAGPDIFYRGYLLGYDFSRPRYDPAKLDWEVRGNS